jgi:hypothetical protein
MQRMKIAVLSGCICFFVGLILGGNLLRIGTSKSTVHADFCFILQHPDLIGTRRFATRANMVSVFPHGSVLEGASCPRLGASFSEHLERNDHSSDLRKLFEDNPYVSVPVEIEGHLYRPTWIHRLWSETLVRFGHKDNHPAIEITAYTEIGQPDSVFALPSSRPE